MKLYLQPPASKFLDKEVVITGSKSESNRLLLLQALYPVIKIENLSNSDDSQVMQKGLTATRGEVDIHHAGTAMRFLTSYFASKPEVEVILTGSPRMRERPIQILVEALQSMGADITYLESPGCPPLKIRGKRLTQCKVSLPANVSSQYISSLLLIAPSLPHGLEMNLIGTLTSVPYIKMTLSLLTELGIPNTFEGNSIRVSPSPKIDPRTITVESDWSSASYYYSLVALADIGSEIRLRSYKKNSLQGDSVLQKIYIEFGVTSNFDGDQLRLCKTSKAVSHLELDLTHAPDLAQTIAVNCFALGISCNLTGLHTLKIKETDRLEALYTELSKFGALIEVSEKSLHLKSGTSIRDGVAVDTYNDHRMAMAFAPLAMNTSLAINEAQVVSKSYPGFWEDMQHIGISIQEN